MLQIIERSRPRILYDLLDVYGSQSGGGAWQDPTASLPPFYPRDLPPLPSPLPPYGTVSIGDLGNQPNVGAPSPPSIYGGQTTGGPYGGGSQGPVGGGGAEGGGSTSGVGGLGGGRATSYPPLVGLPPAGSSSSTSGGTPVSSSGINWQNVLGSIGQAIQGFGQGYLAPRGQAQGQQPSRGTQVGSQGQTNAPPRMQTQAPQVPFRMQPQAMPGGSATATMPVSPLQLPSGSFAPLSPNILSTPMPQFVGSYQQGGIVPRTGLYPVQGGEKVIPKKKVQKIAKLHKGELVLPRYMGSYQQGGDIPLDPTQLPPGSAAPLPPDVLGSSDPTVPQGPSRLRQYLALATKLAQGRQQGTAGGGGGAAPVQGGGVVFPGRAGTPGPIMAPPQMNTVGGAFGAAGGAVGNLMQQAGLGSTQIPQIAGIPQGGAPMQPGAAGGPMAYSQGASLPPYQNQFAPGGRASYVTQNLLGGLSNAVLLYKQRQFDKTAETSKADAMHRMQIEQERQQQQQQQGQPPAGGAQPAQPGASPAQQQGAAASTGLPPQQPIPEAGVQGAPPPAMTNEQKQTYASLQKQNPKFAERYMRELQRNEARSMRAYAKAQTDPTSPEYRGYMMAYQEKQAQQTAQAEMQAKQMVATAQAANAAAQLQQLDMQRQMMQSMQGSQLFDRSGFKNLSDAQKEVLDTGERTARMTGDYTKWDAAVKAVAGEMAVSGRIREKNFVPSPQSSVTGFAQDYYDANGNFVRRVEDVVNPQLLPRLSSNQKIVYDADGTGHVVTTYGTSQRALPSQQPATPTPGRTVTVPPTAPGSRGAPPGTFAPPARTTGSVPSVPGRENVPLTSPGAYASRIAAEARTLPFQSKIPQMAIGSTPDGRQIAGTPAQLRAANAQGITQAPEQIRYQTEIARQLTSPNGLFALVNKDLASFKPGELSPLNSRWQEFLAGKWGAGADKRYLDLRTHLNGLLDTAMLQAHVGARGGVNMMEHFQDIAHAGTMSGETIKQAIDAERQYVDEKAMWPTQPSTTQRQQQQGGGYWDQFPEHR